MIGFWQKSGSTTNPDLPLRLLRLNGDSDASLDGSGMQNDDGWLDQNPEAKMHLSDLSIEENISDDELEVRRGVCHTHTHTHMHTHTCTHTCMCILCMLLQSNVETDDDEEEFDKIIPTPRSNSLSALSSMKSEDMLKCYADPTWRLQVCIWVYQ